MIPTVFRNMVEADRNFIINSFVEGARYPVYAAMNGPVYRKRYSDLVRNLLDRSRVLVACLPDESSVIAGYVVYGSYDEIPVIHWVHTRKQFQRTGLACALIESVIPTWKRSITVVTHLPNPGAGEAAFTKSFYICKEEYVLSYDPFLLHKDI